MLIILVFIEQNCTFNLKVSRLCVSVSTGHLPTGTPCLIWCALTQKQALSSRSVHALFGIRWTQHWGIQGSCDKDVCAIF